MVEKRYVDLSATEINILTDTVSEQTKLIKELLQLLKTYESIIFNEEK